MDHTYYTDAFLDASLPDHIQIELNSKSLVDLKDEEMDEMPIPTERKTEFYIEFGFSSNKPK